MDQQTNIRELLKRYKNKECTAEEAEQVLRYIHSSENEDLVAEIISEGLLDEIPDAIDSNEAVRNKLDFIFDNIERKRQTPQIISFYGKYSTAILIAASIATIIAALVLYYNHYNTSSKPKLLTSIIDIPPGGNNAVLTLANGSKINLSNAKNGVVAAQNGSDILKTSDGMIIYTAKENGSGKEIQYNTISTPKGGQYQIRLPDNSIVWLNAASSITYATSLNERGERRVSLESGEAYFEVAKDKSHPFIVSSATQEVTVLGTHFNINNYSDESTVRTTLLEGKVSVHSLKGSSPDKVLWPGQQSSISGSNINISSVDMETAIAWKNGLFVFNDTDVPTIMRQISRWYNVEVEFSGTVPHNLISGGIERNSSLATTMKMLEMVGIKYKLVQVGQTKKIIID